MYKIFEHLKEQVIRFQLWLVPAGLYITLYASQNIWAGYVAGIAIVVILTSVGIFGKTFRLGGTFSKPDNQKYSADDLGGFLIMYTILFLMFFAPLAAYVQAKYDVTFFDKKTFQYFTSEINIESDDVRRW